MAVPAAPILSARNTGNGAIRLAWPVVPTATTYELLRAVTSPFVSEVQQVIVNATGGTFTITYSGQTTAAIAANETAVNVQTALENLSNIAVGDVTVTRTGSVNNYTYVLTFAGDLAYRDLTQITTNAASLTGGTASATPSTTTAGVGAAVSSALTNSNAPAYFDTTGATATDYYYALRAKNAEGYGVLSNTVHVLRADDTNLLQSLRVNVVQSVPVPTA